MGEVERESYHLVRQNIDLLEKLAEVTAERDALAQAMWEARGILGFDNDGDRTPQAMVAGMGWDGFRKVFLDNMREQRQAYDGALDEIPDAALAADDQPAEAGGEG